MIEIIETKGLKSKDDVEHLCTELRQFNSNIKHENLLTYYDYFTSYKHLHIVTEYCEVHFFLKRFRKEKNIFILGRKSRSIFS